MSDQELRESTASEPLTLQEEYEMCERWAQDQDSKVILILMLFSLMDIKILIDGMTF
jgi:hypothetical protein